MNFYIVKQMVTRKELYIKGTRFTVPDFQNPRSQRTKIKDTKKRKSVFHGRFKRD